MSVLPPVLTASLSLAAALAWGGCVEPSAFACSADSECSVSGAIGTCEEVGFCSFPDAACPKGRRFGELAGHGLASQCVGPSSPIEGTEASTGPSGGQPPVATSSTTSTSTFGTASEHDETGHEWADTGTVGTSLDGISSTSDAWGSTSEPTGDGGSSGVVEPCAYSIDDSFEDGDVHEQWYQTFPRGAEVREEDGQLELALPPAPQWNTIVSRQLEQAMVGGYVRVHLTEIADAFGPASSGVLLSIGICDLQLYAHDGMLRIHRWSDNHEDNEQLHSEPLALVFPQWLQLRQDEDGVVFFEHSVDEAQWSELFSAAFPECGDVFAPPKIGVFAGGDSPVPVVRRFESISVCVP